MKIKEYNQMMAYLTREARNPTPRVDFKLAETGRELSKDYADGRLVRPKNIKDKFPKVMFDKSTNKFTAMDPKDNKLVDEIYNSPDPTAAVKKLVKDTAPPDVNTNNKELNNTDAQMIRVRLSIIWIQQHILVTQSKERNYLSQCLIGYKKKIHRKKLQRRSSKQWTN